jgi:hypothetical protein
MDRGMTSEENLAWLCASGRRYLLGTPKIALAFDHVQQHPIAWRGLRGRFRRYLLQRFPYGVIYAIEGQAIYVAAVMHLKRKPGYWVPRGQGK